jgi:O-antigen/teichoic acid export membrane protein/aminoglycoside phosphotransferase (APT) family kinase protein
MADIKEHLRVPLFRNGYALAFSSALTSGLGMLYWILAARLYSVENVGLNSALLSAMTFLAGMSQLNMVNALNRFIPRAGKSTRRLIVATYAVSVGIAMVASFVFVAGARWWSPALNTFFQANPSFVGLFMLATMGWCIFVLQDSALTGLREATWVPLENFVFAIIKIGLLVGLATFLADLGIFASWVLPLLLILVLVNWLIFGRLVPKHMRVTAEKAEPVVAGEIARYVAADYAGTLIWTATTNLLPLLVFELAGAEANAYFYLSWTITYSLYLVSRNMGMSLITEAAADESKLAYYSYRVLRQNGRLLIPTVAILVVGAPLLLGLFGSAYAESATGVLRLLCLSALPNIVTTLYVSMVRVQRRMKALLIMYMSMCALVIGFTFWLLPLLGILGIGVAWLVGQTIVALVLLATELRPIWIPYVNTRAVLSVFAVPLRFMKRSSRQKQFNEATSALATWLPGLQVALATAEWQVSQILPTVGELTVALVEQPNGETAVLKLAQTPEAAQSLHREHEALNAIQQIDSLGTWRRLVPKPIWQGTVHGTFCLIEQCLPGQIMEQYLTDKTSHAAILQETAQAITTLHQQTMQNGFVNEQWLETHVIQRCDRLKQFVAAAPLADVHQSAIDKLCIELTAALVREQMPLGWVHGDFTPANILLSQQGRAVSAIVDWELARPDELTYLDLVHLLLTVRMIETRQELGDVVKKLLQANEWKETEENVLLQAAKSFGLTLPSCRTLVLYGWLTHIDANLTKSSDKNHSLIWRLKNVNSVLHIL